MTDVVAALLVRCPAAEPVVGRHRAQLDRAARVGVPAHVTVLFPFKTDVDAADHHALRRLFEAHEPFVVHFDRTDWFDDRVVFVRPADPTPLVALTEAVQAGFPDYPIYRGAFDQVVPHLTVGDGQPPAELRSAECAVSDLLPFSQPVDRVELWSGPPPIAPDPQGRWRLLRYYPLGNR